MLYAEAKWIKELVASRPNEFSGGGICLNLGSSTLKFRSEIQPYIETLVIKGIEGTGLKVINIDLQESEGVDLVMDFCDTSNLDKLKGFNPKLVLVSNLLEHVVDYRSVVKSISEIVPTGGYLLLTGPRLYPNHPDPIDNGFRPKKKELQKLFGDFFDFLEFKYVIGGNVLTASSQPENRRDDISYLLSRFNRSTLKKSPGQIYSAVKNSFTPAVAFCSLLRKVPSNNPQK
jgi:hypothetical protein